MYHDSTVMAVAVVSASARFEEPPPFLLLVSLILISVRASNSSFMWKYKCNLLGYHLGRPHPRKSLCNKYLLANLEICSDAFIDSHSKSAEHYGNQPVNDSARNRNNEFPSHTRPY
jgi:hypothetical protein